MACRPENQTPEEKQFCEFAHALRPAYNRDYLDSYLLGPLNPEQLANYIYHNKTHHGCDVREQLGHLIRIMESRACLGFHYDINGVRKIVEKKVNSMIKKAAQVNEVSNTFQMACFIPISMNARTRSRRQQKPSTSNEDDSILPDVTGIGSNTPKKYHIRRRPNTNAASNQ
ncbi:unnamed protein product [Caenorhabditis sp. 36 PRJEB53466]|nr:unnamed protein product [Caenorhabditis sp. 36 PRJEB53466]